LSKYWITASGLPAVLIKLARSGMVGVFEVLDSCESADVVLAGPSWATSPGRAMPDDDEPAMIPEMLLWIRLVVGVIGVAGDVTKRLE